uniref:Uncharacterized protein n=1 Tax=Cyanistes caeruleus TaxID=156563 RepID=A0A8C0V589_CYACU
VVFTFTHSHSHCGVLEYLNYNDVGDIKALADDHASVLFQAAGGCSLDCMALLLKYGGGDNVPGEVGLLPMHKVACEGYYLGLSTVHSTVDGQNQCLELVIGNGLDVNTLSSKEVTSNTYDGRRKTAFYCAVSNNEIICTKILLKAGANPSKDPFNCVLVAVRADSHGIVNAYSLNGDMMLRLLFSHGYNEEMCLDFMCQGVFGNSFVWPAPEHAPIPSWTTSSIKDTLVNLNTKT